MICELAQAAPRLAQLMTAPSGALRKLVELASFAQGAEDELPLGHRSVYTTLRIMHSFARALPDPQACHPPISLGRSTVWPKQPLLCVYAPARDVHAWRACAAKCLPQSAQASAARHATGNTTAAC